MVIRFFREGAGGEHEQGNPPGPWARETILTVFDGNPNKASFSEMVLRPSQMGVCKISECKNELSLTDLLLINIALDKRNDIEGLSSPVDFPDGHFAD